MVPEYGERRLAVARTARVGMLGALAASTTDVWVVLHGYGQLAASFAASAAWPVNSQRVFLFPEALQRFYDAAPGASHHDAPVGASWMTRESRDDDIADNLAYVSDVVADARSVAPRARLTVLGFSQGGATAARWVAREARGATLPLRLILWGSGMPPDVDVGADSALQSVRVEFVVGTRDRWVTAERVAAERTRLASAPFAVAVHEFAGGHRLDDAMIAALAG